jgi:hypothetical protein
MKTAPVATGDELEEIVNGIRTLLPTSRITLIAACNFADRTDAPRRLDIRGSEIKKGNLVETVQKLGVKHLADLLQRTIELNETHLVIGPHQLPKED